jgi:hypothetical protein
LGCEVLSPSTERLDRGEKLRVYVRERVAYVWFIDPARETLEVLALDRRGQWAKRGVLEGRVNVRAAPFDAIDSSSARFGSEKQDSSDGDQPCGMP